MLYIRNIRVHRWTVSVRLSPITFINQPRLSVQVMRNNSECDKADESLFKPSRPKLNSGLEIDGV